MSEENITKEQVNKIAELARLEMSEKETEKMQKDLAEILGYIDMLKEVDIANIEPTNYSVRQENIMREDNAEKAGDEIVKDMLAQAPEKQGNYIKVKEILK